MARGNGKALLGADDIIGAPDLGHEDVEVPEWGGTVRIGALSEEQLSAAFRAVNEDQESKLTLRVYMLGRALIDADGNRLFDDESMAALNRKNPRVIGRLYSVFERLNAFGNQGAETTEKNSEGTRGDTSLSS